MAGGPPSGGGIGGINQYMSQGQQPSGGFGGGVSIGGGGPPNSFNPSGMPGLQQILSLFNNSNPAPYNAFLQEISRLTGGGAHKPMQPGGGIATHGPLQMGGGGGPMQSFGGPYRHIA